MSLKKKNVVLKFIPILLNIIRSILTPMLTLILSYIIINNFSKTLWGNFVEIQLYFFIALIFADWGTKTYLQKAFSNNPSNMIANWQQQFLARIPIALLCLVGLFFFIELDNIFFLVFWFLSAFFFNSFLSILFYNRDYILLIIIEVSSFLLLNTLFIITKEDLTINKFIVFYAIYIFYKAIIVSIKYHKFLKFKTVQINITDLKFGFPFLLIGITGFLHSKIDLYTYSFFSNSIALGEYQIISSFFIFSQSAVTILLFPYIKNIYRINLKSLKKLRVKLAFFGIFINTFIIILIAYLLRKYFLINLTFIEYIAGFFISYPSYIYSIKVFEFFKLNKEKRVVIISIIGLLLNFTLSITLLLFKANILAVLSANAITQIITMLIYFIPSPKGSIVKT